jgi:hypothetical protein
LCARLASPYAASGDGILKIGKKLGIGTSVVQRVFRQEPWQS